jgi:DNA-binding transcriptional regulator LsrR (DeoR family)
MVRDALLGEPQISGTLALAERANVALVGIGQPGSESVVTRSGILSEAELQQLRELGAVGDIALRFFDAEGRAVEHEIDVRIVGLTLGQIRQIRRVIGVAGGPDKHDAVRAALRGGLIDVLVTDQESGEYLLAG